MSCEGRPVLTIVNGSDELTLDGSAGVDLLLGSIGLDVAPRQLQHAPYVAADGSVRTQSRRPVRPVTLPLLLESDVRVHNVLATLADLMVPGPFEVRRDDGTNVRTLRNCEYVAGLEGDDATADQGGDAWMKRVVSIEALDPWWYGDEKTATLDLSANGEYDEAADYDEAASYDGDAANPITVNGTTEAAPLVRIDGPFTTLRVSSASGDVIELAAALADGDYIEVDSTVGNRGPRKNAGAVDWSLITAASRPLSLPRGTSTLSVAATGTGGNSNVEVRYSERWQTP